MFLIANFAFILLNLHVMYSELQHVMHYSITHQKQ